MTTRARNRRTTYQRARPITTHPASAGERRLVGTFLGSFAMAAAISAVALAAGMLAASRQDTPVSDPWDYTSSRSLQQAAQWFLGDMTEAQFYKSDLASAGLLLGAALAWLLVRRGSTRISLAYGSGRAPAILLAASLSLALSNLLFDSLLINGWQPTFVPFVCAAPALVLVYGPSLRVIITGAILGCLTTTPIALILFNNVTQPLGIPAVLASTTAMAVGTAITFLIAAHCRWMTRTPPTVPLPDHARHASPKNDALWAARRVLADFTEPQFLANELASIALILAVSVAYVLEPRGPSYGSLLLPQILCAQALSSAIGITLWRAWYRNGGWAATYVPVASVAPAMILLYGGSPIIIIGGATIGAVAGPPLARVFAARLPFGYHPVIANTAAMTVATALAALLLLPAGGSTGTP